MKLNLEVEIKITGLSDFEKDFALFREALATQSLGHTPGATDTKGETAPTVKKEKPKKEPAPKAPKPPTKDEVMVAFAEFVKNKPAETQPRAKAKAILSQFGVGNVHDLKEEDYPKVLGLLSA